MTTRWARFARGWIATIVSLFVAACSNALADGGLLATVGLALRLASFAAGCVVQFSTTASALPPVSPDAHHWLRA